MINPVGALHEAASLLSLHATAKPGPGVASAATRFGSAQPAMIRAVQHPVFKLAGFGGAIVVGAALLPLAFWVRSRGRRVAAGRLTVVSGAGPPPAAASAPSEPV
jgi:hypothetical protein